VSASAPVPPRYCDIVMKGGITSGVVYPLVVCQLAEKYFFRNIGGTSAGAIAAAAAAAAELGRGKDIPGTVPAEGAGFARLAKLPDWLGKDDHLFNLFQPQDRTRRLFTVATAGLNTGSAVSSIMHTLSAVLQEFSVWAVLGAAPGIVLIVVAVFFGHDASLLRGVAMAAGALLAVIGLTIGIGVGIATEAAREVPQNHFGLSRGFDQREATSRPGLVNWLECELNALAGRRAFPEDPPLTFGDLRRHEPGGVPLGTDEPGIALRMVTTNLTHGRPYGLPFDAREVLFFDPEELKDYFPEHIVAHMVRHAGKGTSQTEDERKVLRVPLPDDLPVIVATRMSLSFPFLISAVPLYAPDWGRPENSGAGIASATGSASLDEDCEEHPLDEECFDSLETAEADDDEATSNDAPKRAEGPALVERCWFSDGGITSNFPVHFFDSMMPRWPTFGVNLRPFTRFHPRSCNQRKNIFMPKRNGAGLGEWWTHFDEEYSGRPRGGFGQLIGFVGAIIDAARNWRDNTQARAAGYRDRVVHIKQADDEGGLNLKMKPEVIANLTKRGQYAGERLVRRFGMPANDEVVLTWPNQRWVRYRTAMRLIHETLFSMRRAYQEPAPGDDSYRDLITRNANTKPNSYRWPSTRTPERYDEATRALFDVLEKWDVAGVDFRIKAPKPDPDLRVTPRF
jgi:hypothetical protein